MPTKKLKAVLDKDGNTINKDCIFPFIYKNKLIKKCVPNKKKGDWCATKVNKRREMVEYGICGTKANPIPIVNNANIRRNNQNIKLEKKTVKASKNNRSPSMKTVRIRKFDLNNIDNELQNNINRLVVPDSMVQYIRPIEDQLKIKIWENPSRKNFLNWFNESFKRYRVRSKTKEPVNVDCHEDGCDMIPKKKKRELFNHQKIVRDYMNTESPYRGLILYHGLGVGKTCASIAIAEGFKDERKIVVLLQKSIKDNYINQLRECGDMYFRNDNHWEFVKTTTEVKRNIALKIGIPPKVLKREGGCFLIDFTKPSNFDSLSSPKKEILNQQILDMINSKYEFKHTNGLTIKQLDDMEVRGYFDNKVVIIDEVHNIINGMASEGSMRAVRLNELFMKAQNMKLIFLSGTPMKNVPFEIAKLYNVLRGPIQLFDISVDSSMRAGNRVNYKELESILQRNELLDQVIVQSKTKNIKVTRNPLGYVRTRDNKGLVKSDRNNLSQAEFMENIELSLSERGFQLKGINTSETSLFPEDSKEFMKRFYDPIKNTITDKETFTRRILGMTSYYSSVDKSLVPEIRTEKTLRVPMSDYMFDKYSIIRKEEIDRDKKSKTATKKSKGKDDVFSISSSYRAYSRMACQFSFPENNPRPYKGDLTDIELNEEDQEQINNVTLEYNDRISKEKSSSKIQELKEELKKKLKELSKTDTEYDKRLQDAIKKLDEDRDIYLRYDDGNKNKLTKYSPKYARIMKEVLRDKDEKKKGLKFIYTEYKTCEGVGVLSIVLRANGYTPFRIKQVNNEWELDFIPGEEKLGKFAVWAGDEESDIILNIYNNEFHKLPEKIRNQVLKLDKTNQNGEVLEILMTTKQGAEGLNTRNVRQLHVVEPYWNPVRLDQVKGRAVRTGSHLDLPPRDRNVDIYIYLSKATKEQISRNITIFNDFDGKTSDEVLYNIADDKRAIMNVMLNMMQNAAIDCSINYGDNIKTQSNIKCHNFGTIKDNNSYSYAPDLNDELKKSERETRVATKAERFKLIQVKVSGSELKKFFKLDTKLYDFDEINSGIMGRPVGEITVNSRGNKEVRLY